MTTKICYLAATIADEGKIGIYLNTKLWLTKKHLCYEKMCSCKKTFVVRKPTSSSLVPPRAQGGHLSRRVRVWPAFGQNVPHLQPRALLNTPVQRELLRTSLRVLSLVLRQVNTADLERLTPRDTTASAKQTLGSPPPGKGKRLKQAKDEAIAEIDHYRLQREKEFRNKQTNVSKKPTYVLL